MKKLLIIEDEAPQRRALIAKFELEGFKVLEAGDGEAGLATALKEKPDAILLDLNMPTLDGFGFLEKLRDNEWGKDAKVVVFTNRDDTDAVADALKYNVFQVFLKAEESLEGIVKEVREFLGE